MGCISITVETDGDVEVPLIQSEGIIELHDGVVVADRAGASSDWGGATMGKVASTTGVDDVGAVGALEEIVTVTSPVLTGTLTHPGVEPQAQHGGSVVTLPTGATVGPRRDSFLSKIAALASGETEGSDPSRRGVPRLARHMAPMIVSDDVCFAVRDNEPFAQTHGYEHFLVAPRRFILDCAQAALTVALLDAMVVQAGRVLEDQVTQCDASQVLMGFHVPPHCSVPWLHMHVLYPMSIVMHPRSAQRWSEPRFVTLQALRLRLVASVATAAGAIVGAQLAIRPTSAVGVLHLVRPESRVAPPLVPRAVMSPGIEAYVIQLQRQWRLRVARTRCKPCEPICRDDEDIAGGGASNGAEPLPPQPSSSCTESAGQLDTGSAVSLLSVQDLARLPGVLGEWESLAIRSGFNATNGVEVVLASVVELGVRWSLWREGEIDGFSAVARNGLWAAAQEALRERMRTEVQTRRLRVDMSLPRRVPKGAEVGDPVWERFLDSQRPLHGTPSVATFRITAQEYGGVALPGAETMVHLVTVPSQFMGGLRDLGLLDQQCACDLVCAMLDSARQGASSILQGPMARGVKFCGLDLLPSNGLPDYEREGGTLSVSPWLQLRSAFVAGSVDRASLGDPIVVPWFPASQVRAVVVALKDRVNVYRAPKRGPVLVGALEAAVRGLLQASLPSPPRAVVQDLVALGARLSLPDANVRQAVELLRASARAWDVMPVSETLPSACGAEASHTLLLFEGVGGVPVGRHSATVAHARANLLTHVEEVQDSQLVLRDTNRCGALVLREEAKSYWADDPWNPKAMEELGLATAEVRLAMPTKKGTVAAAVSGLPRGYFCSAQAIALAATARNRTAIVWQGRTYSTRCLGVWQRVLWLWRARITGWFTAAETVLYYAIVKRMVRGVVGAREELAALVERTRYAKGRLPGCSRYCEMSVRIRYRWSMEKLFSVSCSPKVKLFAYPLDSFGFTVSRHSHRSVLRLGAVPLWCYFRHKNESRCLFGLSERPTPAHYDFIHLLVERSASHFGVYTQGFTQRFGPPLQVHKGCLPGGLTRGTYQEGFEVAGIDISPKSVDYERFFRNAQPRVTFTMGNGMDPLVEELARRQHHGRRHTSTFTSYNCGPHTSLNALRETQGLDNSRRVLGSALGVEHQAFVRYGTAWFHESVVASVADVMGYDYTIITGFMTGEKSADRHVIFHEKCCPPLVDSLIREKANWIMSHTCGGGLRPFQHLGPDNVPVFLGERDPADPTKWVRYMKPGGGWVHRKPWYCCPGDNHGVYGTMPAGVSHADWCSATGNSPDHIRDVQQLKNALWPRLGALLSPQLQMYHMAAVFGFPVVDVVEAGRDELLDQFLRSLLFCRGPWPSMPFQAVYVIIAPVSDHGTVLLTNTFHIPLVRLPTRTATFVADLASALSEQYPLLSIRSEYMRFVGVINVSRPQALVFSVDVIDDDARKVVRVGGVAVTPDGKEGTEELHSVQLVEYMQRMLGAAGLGSAEWGIDLVLMRAYLRSPLALRRRFGELDDPSIAAFVQPRHGVGSGDYRVHTHSSTIVSQVYQPNSVMRTRPLLANIHTAKVRLARGGRGVQRIRRTQAENESVFQDDLSNLGGALQGRAGEALTEAVAQWEPKGGAVRCRVMTLELAAVMYPLVQRADAAPKVVLPSLHNFKTRFKPWRDRYTDKASALGVDVTKDKGLVDLGDKVIDAPVVVIFRPPVVHAVCCVVSHREEVLSVARGGLLVPFTARRTVITRGLLASDCAQQEARYRALVGLVWIRELGRPQGPIAYASLKPHYERERSQRRTLGGEQMSILANRSLVQHLGMALKRNPKVTEVRVTNAQLREFGLRSGEVRLDQCVAVGLSKTDRFKSGTETVSTVYFRAARGRPAGPIQPVRSAVKKDALEVALLMALQPVLQEPRGFAIASDGFESHPFLNAMPVLLMFIQEYAETGVVELGLLSWRAQVYMLDAACTLRDGHGITSFQRSLRTGVAALRMPVCQTTRPIRSQYSSSAPGYDIRYEVFRVTVPSGVVVPCIRNPEAYPHPDPKFANRRFRNLRNGATYACAPTVLYQHLWNTQRVHLAILLEGSLTTKLGMPAEATCHFVTTDVLVSAAVRSSALRLVTEALVSTWLSTGQLRPARQFRDLSLTMQEVADGVFKTHTDYSCIPFVDLACDARVMQALNSGSKRVESRFARGVLARLPAGVAVRMWCPRPSVMFPASKYPVFRYVRKVVFERSFQRLYEAYGHYLLPGTPHSYVSALPPSSSSSAVRWKPAEVEAVYMSLYRNQYMTVEAWRESQKRGARNVVGLYLVPFPAGFLSPTGTPLNPRHAAAARTEEWGSDQLTISAVVVVQSRVRALLARSRWPFVVEARRRVLHVALLNGWALHVRVYGCWSPCWMRYSRPRWVGFGAACRLQASWRARSLRLVATPAGACEECSRADAATRSDEAAVVEDGTRDKPGHLHCHMCSAVVRRDWDMSCSACGTRIHGVKGRTLQEYMVVLDVQRRWRVRTGRGAWQPRDVVILLHLQRAWRERRQRAQQVAAQVEADAGVLQRKMACTHRNRERFDEVNPVHLTAMRSQDDSLLGLRSLDYERPVLAEQPISYEDLMHQAHPTVRFASQNFIFRASAVGTADPELAILHRADGYAFVAGGKRDVNDSSPRCTAMRETIEEAGVAIRSVAMVRCAILTGSHFKSRWILQDFACFLDDEYASQVSVCSPREHKSLEWVRLSRLQELHALDGLASRASVAWAAIAANGVPEMTHRRRALSRRFVGNLRQLVQGVPSPFVGKVEQVQAGLMQVHEGGKAAVVLQDWWRSRRRRRRAVLLHHDVWSHDFRAGSPGTSDPTASRRPSPRARPHVRLPIGSLTARGRSIHRLRLGKSSQMTRRRMRAEREDSAVRIQQEWRVHAGCCRHERELAAEFREGIAELVDSMFASVIARVVRRRVRSIVARHFYERNLLVMRECLRARAGRRLRLRNAWCSFSAVLLNRAVTLWQDRAVRIDLAWAFECIAFRHFYEKTWPGRRLQLSNAWCSLCARGGSAVLLSRAVTLWQDRAMRIDLAWAFELLALDRLYDKNRRIASVQALWDRHQEAVAVAGSSEVAPASVGDMVPLYKRMSPETALIMRSEREAKEAREAKEVSEGGASRPSGRHPALTQSRLPTNAEIELANKRAHRSGRVFAARPGVAPETGLFFEGVGGSTGVVSIASADPTQARRRRLLATKIQTAFRGKRVRKLAVFSGSQMATFDPSDKAQHKDVTRSASAVGEKVATILMVHGGEPTAAELEATARARAPGDAGGGMGVLVSVADDEEIGMFGTVLSYPTRRLDWVPATDRQDTFEEDLATGLRLSMQRVQPKQKARGGRKQAFLEAAAEAICKREGRRPPTKQRQQTLRTVHEAVPEPDREEDEVRCRAAKLIQLRFCLHVSRCCRRQTRDAKVAMAWPGKRVTGEPSSMSQMVSIEELVCDACGDTGLIDDEGVCARCKSHHTTSSQLERRKGMGQARALLTFTEGSSCS